MTFIYEFNLAGAKLAWRHLCNKVNGNDKLIREYFAISGRLLDAQRDAKSKNRKQKVRRAYNEFSESKIVPLGGDKFDLQGYNAGMATRAQNHAKVLQGRAMLERLGLSR